MRSLAAGRARPSSKARLRSSDRGAQRADRVVLGDARHAERRQHTVAEKLHDAAAVHADGGRHRAVIAVHPAPRGLGVESLVQRDRADQVGEDDRDDLARGRVGRGPRRECGAAAVAEAVTRGCLRSAGRTARRSDAPQPLQKRACRVAVSAARAVHRGRSVAAILRPGTRRRIALPAAGGCGPAHRGEGSRRLAAPDQARVRRRQSSADAATNAALDALASGTARPSKSPADPIAPISVAAPVARSIE